MISAAAYHVEAPYNVLVDAGLVDGLCPPTIKLVVSCTCQAITAVTYHEWFEGRSTVIHSRSYIAPLVDGLCSPTITLVVSDISDV